MTSRTIRDIHEARLTPTQFRLMVYIAGFERGCAQTVGAMAHECRLNHNTVRAAAKALAKRRMISIGRIPGYSNTYQATPSDRWN